VRVALGVDHRGFLIKDEVIAFLKDEGHDVVDCGTDSTESVDYPDTAAAVAKVVLQGDAERGVVVCGSGAGAAIAANKIHGIRCAQAHDTYTAHQCVEHDDANVLSLGSAVVGIELVREIVRTFLGARFESGVERYTRRLEQVKELENRG
jgi:RpiB/LacA/LacB family sugar-phosphate isomerase